MVLFSCILVRYITFGIVHTCSLTILDEQLNARQKVHVNFNFDHPNDISIKGNEKLGSLATTVTDEVHYSQTNHTVKQRTDVLLSLYAKEL